MNDSSIILNVHMEAVPGREKDLENQLRALVTPSRNEPGCISYDLYGDPDGTGRFMLVEKFKNQESLNAHRNSAHFEKWKHYRTEQGDPVATSRMTRWRAIETI